jgi:hypothetical protein
MVQQKIQLPSQTPLFLITGVSGYYDDKATWVVCAYTQVSYAQKACTFLQKLADKINNYPTRNLDDPLYRNLVDELRLHDPSVYVSDTDIQYLVVDTKVVI